MNVSFYRIGEHEHALYIGSKKHEHALFIGLTYVNMRFCVVDSRFFSSVSGFLDPMLFFCRSVSESIGLGGGFDTIRLSVLNL